MSRAMPQETRELVQGGVRQALEHDSGTKHVSGEARYIDDLPEPPQTLQVYVAMSRRPHARITALDLSAVRAAPGVACVLTASDIPGANDVSPVPMGVDPVFAEEVVEYIGQSIFAVAAETVEQARRVAKLARVTYEDLEPVLTIDQALAAESFVLPPHEMRIGEAGAALAKAPERLQGTIRIGGQDHFYLEGQIALALPQEDGDVHIYSSTQHPTEVQHNVARVLGRRTR